MFVESSRGVCFFQAISPAKAKKKSGAFLFPGFSPEDWSSKLWQALANKSLVFHHTHLRNHNNLLKLPSFTPKKMHLVQRIPFEAWIFGATICFSLLRPTLWSKEVHGLTYRETRYEVQRSQRSIQRVPMLPEARWPNWCLRCRICPGHLPLDVSCRSRSRCFFGGRNWCWQLTTFLNKKTTKNLETAGIYHFFYLASPKRKKREDQLCRLRFRGSAVSRYIRLAGPHDELEELHIHQATNHGSRGCLRMISQINRDFD